MGSEGERGLQVTNKINLKNSFLQYFKIILCQIVGIWKEFNHTQAHIFKATVAAQTLLANFKIRTSTVMCVHFGNQLFHDKLCILILFWYQGRRFWLIQEHISILFLSQNFCLSLLPGRQYLVVSKCMCFIFFSWVPLCHLINNFSSLFLGLSS